MLMVCRTASNSEGREGSIPSRKGEASFPADGRIGCVPILPQQESASSHLATHRRLTHHSLAL